MEDETIPFLAVEREFEENREAFLGIAAEVLSSGWLLQGESVRRLEHRVAQLCQRSHAIAVGSCTDALFFALRAAGIGPGDDVLVTDFSFVASASAIVRIGARPVFVDIGPDRHADLNDARRRITPQTRAFVCVHLYGRMNSPCEVQTFCAENELVLIEDAAQSFGAQRERQPAGSMGLVSCLSFDPTKVISAPSTGGMVLTDDEVVAERVRRMHYHGKSADGTFDELGFNSQFSCLSAALVEQKLEWREAWLSRRKALFEFYDRHLPDELTRTPPASLTSSVYHRYVVECPQRDRLSQHLASRGIQCRIDFARPLHRERVFREFAQNETFPVANRCAERVLSLPLHPFLRREEVQRVVDETKKFFAAHQQKAA